MQSKFSRQRLLSSKTIFIAAPCFIGLTAIAALLTSMSMKRSRLSVVTPNVFSSSEQISQDSSTASSPAQKTIAATPLGNQNISNINPEIVAPPSQTPKPTTSAKASSPSTQTPAPSQKSVRPQNQASGKSKPVAPQPTQSALSMQAFSPAAANDVPQVPIRVAIVRAAQSFTVATSESGLITDSQGQILEKISAQSSLGVSAHLGGLQLGSQRSSEPLWIRTKSKNGLVFVNGQWYRGLVQLIPDQGGLLAVNHVEMQPYLYSVVGAEMFHDWPIEALKAQAIAARSYALVHIVRPASSHYDLGSTQRWQAYKGVNSEASPVRTAVDQTRGIVISHQGGVVESLYASSAELVRDAHKGFGMSQYGARDLAAQNLNHRQILSRFYPGTELSLLQTQ